MRRAAAPAPVATHSGTQPKMNANEVIRMGRKAQLGPFERGLDHRLALLELRLRELDDEDGVLGREADEHDEPDLRVDVVVEVPRHQAEEGAEDRHRRRSEGR